MRRGRRTTGSRLESRPVSRRRAVAHHHRPGSRLAGRSRGPAEAGALVSRSTRSWRSPAHAQKEDALAGLDRWKARHPEVAAHLEPADVMVDAMRGRFTTWTRVRVNLQHVPEDARPPQEPLDPDEDVNDWNVSAEGRPRRRPSRARKES